ncbi:peptide chain release factor 1 [Syntrophomonas wolfei]|uniref:Peptide chain release factor 1 n=1 Tax=Syntrophomonas wolfei subsp. wolfei (strain DSM 2245B / Goettingen) TaxID=335541 RepID=RF1_SYNWW|nr:peptide chain release factor 1 [Syntrophomonas wolfei]Q0AUB8.1 RecName: Full=Peptide chain release factor 1; Short=RF-1 [Syntrophomonas wolfei subsp. wolfei str. Goettingen G311]ABI69686.1 bacterial peptide chain release factor 1 (bRF-1) [Syntrophomonas wolfei subsp. wolfei str. Goettingen G311]
MLEKLDSLEEKYDELTHLLSQPEVLSDQARFQKLAKAHSALSDIVTMYREYKSLSRQLEDSKEMLVEEEDEEFRQMLADEIPQLQEKKASLEQELRILLLPQDPNDEKSVIMEIRAGTGGEEAALFAGDLFRMYSRYAEEQGWKIEIMDTHYTDIGGIKEIVFVVDGRGAYSKLKFESGVHRVQRIPVTESGGRIHTSAATVAVLPEAEEVEVAIDPNDLRIDVYCSSGPGGQSVNTTQSAVRITHVPTGEVVTCQDEKSQHKNKAKALRVLRARLKELLEEEKNAEMAGTRKNQVGSGDRSERIRTYNFPQGRVSDHRINLTLHRLESVLEGRLEEIINALIAHYQAERLKQVD